MKQTEKEAILEIAEKLYSLNACISGYYITEIKKPTMDDIMAVNTIIGQQIRKLRKVVEE